MGGPHVPHPDRVAIPVTQGRPQNAPLFAWCERYGPIFVDDMPVRKPLLPPQTAVRADLSQMSVKPAAPCKRKMAPEFGTILSNYRTVGRSPDRACSAKACIFQAQRPKRGRSPLRMAMRLLVVSRRSMEAIRRPNRVAEGRRPMDAVLD